MQDSLLAVRAAVGVDAGVGKAESFDGAAVEEVLLHDLFGVAGFGETVPDGVGIDNEDGTVFALIKASRFVDADLMFEAGGFDGIFKGTAKLLGMAKGAARASGFVALVKADKDVVFEDRHRGIGCTGGGFEMRHGWGIACENKGYGIR
jgi:hypothetical protein